jgi:hypothetical protein
MEAEAVEEDHNQAVLDLVVQVVAVLVQTILEMQHLER